MPRARDISELVRRAQNGDRESLGVLSARVRRRMFVYLYRLTLDYHLAEDLVQETVLYMIEALPRLKTSSSLSLWAWIYRSAWGICRHYLRPQGHQRIVQQTVVDHEALLELTDTHSETAIQHAERSELFEAICKSLGTLRTKHRNVVVLRCFEQLSHAEIAAVMGCSELKARVLFFHAKRALKRQLHNRGFGRRYFLTGVSLFGTITAARAKGASAAITVTSSLIKAETMAATISAVTAKVGLVKASVITIVLFAGAIHVCTSDADVPAEPTVYATTSTSSAFSLPENTSDTKFADLLPEELTAEPALPDPCSYEPLKSKDALPAEPTAKQPLILPAVMVPPPAQANPPAEPNEIKNKAEPFEGLVEALEQLETTAASEQRHWAQTKYDNRTSLARAVRNQITDELELLHKIAVEEKATSTAEAIESLVAEKKTAYKAVLKELLRQPTQAATRSTRTRRRHGRANTEPQESPDCMARQEVHWWTQATDANRSELARTIHEQSGSELVLIRNLATEEQALKTTALIDGLLLQRAKRLDALAEKLREQKSRLQRDQEPEAGRLAEDGKQTPARTRNRNPRRPGREQANMRQPNTRNDGSRRR